MAYTPALVDLHSGVLQAEFVGVGTAADADHHGIDLDALALAEVHDGAATTGGRVAGDLHPGADVDVLLLEAAHHDVGEIRVEAGQHLRHPLEDGDRGAEIGEGAGELASDGAAADDHHAGGHSVEHEHFVAGHHRAAGHHVEAGDGARHRTRGQQHMAAGEGGASAFVQTHGDGAVGAERAGAADDLDLLRLHEPAEALHDAVDDLLLAGLRHGEVHRGGARLDAELGGVGDVSLYGGCLEEGLGGDAATVQAGAADGALLDHGHLQAGRCGVERRAVATRAAADDDQVELVVTQGSGVHRWGSSCGQRRIGSGRRGVTVPPFGAVVG
jgi:hypothetical protein